MLMTVDCSDEGCNYAAGLLSEAGLAFIATRLGFEWTLVALQLGVRQEKVEQVQMSLRNTYQQILEVLRFWRDLPVISSLKSSDLQEDGGGDANRSEEGKALEKIHQLLQTLQQDGIDKNQLVQEIKDRFHIELDE